MAVTRTFTDRAFAELSSTSHTFTGRSIGAADADRFVFVVVRHQSADGSTMSGAVIGGVSATRAALSSRDGGIGHQVAEIWFAAVPSGATADIQVSGVSTNQVAAIAVFRVLGVDAAEPIADDDGGSGAAGSASISLDVPAGGAIIAGSMTGVNTSPSFSIAWSGATEDEDTNDGSGGIYFNFSAASRETGSVLSAETVSVTRSGSAAFNLGTVIAGVAINPAASGGVASIAPKAMHYRRLRT